jgi:hypothetical protein
MKSLIFFDRQIFFAFFGVVPLIGLRDFNAFAQN